MGIMMGRSDEELAVKEAFTAVAGADPVGEWDEVDVFLSSLDAAGFKVVSHEYVG